MLTDPLVVTYNSVAKTLPRGAGVYPGPVRSMQSTFYGTADQEFGLRVQQHELRDGFRTEILLGRRDIDPASNPYMGRQLAFNRFGLVYEVNTLYQDTAVDVPRLRTALLALVDSTLQGRLIAGEL